MRWAWDELGHLTGVERVGADGSSERLDLGLDAWGRPFRVGGDDVEWDVLSGRPSRIGTRRYLHLAGRARAAEPGATWQPAPLDPWGTTANQAGGAGLGFRDELSAWGLVWMGARVYDTTTREFLSPDPLPAVPGQPGSASLYAYGFLDPVNHLDPSGQRPISQQEFDAIREREEQGRFGQAWEAIKDDPWGTLAAVAITAVGVALVATGVGSGVGVAILVGVAMSAVPAVLTGTLDPTSVAVAGVLGFVPGGNSYRAAIAYNAAASAGAEGVRQGLRGDFDLNNLVVETALGGAGGAVSRGINLRMQGAPAAHVTPPTAPVSPMPQTARFVVDGAGEVTDLGPRVATHQRPIVIGEAMRDRVIPAAQRTGADWYDPPTFDTTDQMMSHNRYWINEQMNQGRGIIDVGPAPGRANFPEVTSDFYAMERDEIMRRGYTAYVQMEP
jgi:RHS repeat-associated protein